MKKLFVTQIVLISLFFVQHLFAGDELNLKPCGKSEVDVYNVPYPYDMIWVSNLTDEEASQVGFKCKTSKGAVFERVQKMGLGEAWLAPDGRVWSQAIQIKTGCLGDPEKCGFFDYLDAERLCGERFAVVPTVDQFTQGESQGIREVLNWGSRSQPGWFGSNFWTSDRESGFGVFGKNYAFRLKHLDDTAGNFYPFSRFTISPYETSVVCLALQ